MIKKIITKITTLLLKFVIWNAKVSCKTWEVIVKWSNTAIDKLNAQPNIKLVESKNTYDNKIEPGQKDNKQVVNRKIRVN